MRNRNIDFHMRLTQSEYDTFCRQAVRAGLSKSTYLRFLMKGLIPQEKPAPEYYQVLQALYRIGNNLNQLSATAHAKGWLHAGRLDEALEEFHQAILLLCDRQVPQKGDTDALLKRGMQAEKEEMQC